MQRCGSRMRRRPGGKGRGNAPWGNFCAWDCARHNGTGHDDDDDDDKTTHGSEERKTRGREGRAALGDGFGGLLTRLREGCGGAGGTEAHGFLAALLRCGMIFHLSETGSNVGQWPRLVRHDADEADEEGRGEKKQRHLARRLTSKRCARDPRSICPTSQHPGVTVGLRVRSRCGDPDASKHAILRASRCMVCNNLGWIVGIPRRSCVFNVHPSSQQAGRGRPRSRLSADHSRGLDVGGWGIAALCQRRCGSRMRRRPGGKGRGNAPWGNFCAWDCARHNGTGHDDDDDDDKTTHGSEERKTRGREGRAALGDGFGGLLTRLREGCGGAGGTEAHGFLAALLRCGMIFHLSETGSNARQAGDSVEVGVSQAHEVRADGTQSKHSTVKYIRAYPGGVDHVMYCLPQADAVGSVAPCTEQHDTHEVFGRSIVAVTVVAYSPRHASFDDCDLHVEHSVTPLHANWGGRGASYCTVHT
nr:hypothetical protein CFP56_24026 [Quercus suber]